MKPIVSVLILTYNQEKYIAQALESAINQVCNFPYEIVVSDDHSSDHTLDICRQFETKYPNKIRLIANPVNKGVVDNYYDTMLMCQGKYIADCAGDDFWTDPYKLQRQVDILENNPELSLTYTDYALYLEESGIYKHHQQNDLTDGTSSLIYFKDYAYQLLNHRGKPFLFIGSACFRKEIFLNIYKQYTDFFRNKQYSCEDYQLLFFLFRSGPIHYETKETTAYRILNNTISHNTDPQRLFRFYYGVFKLRTRLISELGFDASRCHEFLDSYSIPLISLCIHLRLEDAQKDILRTIQSMKHKPSLKLRLRIIIAKSIVLSWLFRKFKSNRQ